MLPLKDLEKLTVVKLRAELIARGLDSKGNKPFLVERLRIALEQEELSGTVRPEIKMHATDTSDLASDTQDQDQMDAQSVDSADPSAPSGHATSPIKGSNGTTEGVLNNGSHPVLATSEEGSTTPQPAAVPDTAVEKPYPNSETTDVSASVEEDKAAELDSSTAPTPNDSVMAVYGGKDETFAMEDSVLDQSAAAAQPQDDSSTDVTDKSGLAQSSQCLENGEKKGDGTPAEVAVSISEDTKTDSSTPTEKAETDTPAPAEEAKMDTSTPVEKVNEDASASTEETQADASASAEETKADASASGEEVKMDTSAPVEEAEGAAATKDDKTEDNKNERGGKRQRDRSSSPSTVNKTAEGPPPEDEPEWDAEQVLLDWYNSDLNLTISKTDFMSAAPLTDGGFAYMWAGVRGTYGFLKGKLCYELKVVEHLPVPHLEESEVNPHLVRLGWSVDSTSLQLGEEPLSCGYGGTGKISRNLEFTDYGTPFQLNDVVGAYMDSSDDKDVVELSFTVNGVPQGVAFTLTKEELDGRPLFPHILTKNCRFEVNFGQREEPWFPPLEGFEWVSQAPTESRVRGSVAPASRGECQMIMMCGLPGSGKTTWANKFTVENPERKFNIIGTNAFLEKMKVNGLPRRKNYNGRWEVLIEKCTRCLNILLEIAAKRRRNYILDQTNVYPTAQKRKMAYFIGFQRKAVVIVPSEEEAKVRTEKRIQEEGKDVPDSAVMEMKANFKMPVVDDIFSEVEFPELPQEEAQKVIDKYSAEAKAAGYGQPSPKRQRQNYGGGGNRSKNDRDSRRHGGSSRDRNRDSRGGPSSNHRSPGRSSYRDSRDDRYRPLPPPPSHWRGGGGPPPGRVGWSGRGPPPPPMHRNGPYSPHRRGPPGPPGPLMGRGGGGGWSAPPPPLDRSYGPGPRSGGGGRSYDDRRNDRPPYPPPRRDAGPSPWMGSPSMGGGSAPPSRGSWGGGSGWSGSNSSSYSQPSSYGAGSMGGGAGANNAAAAYGGSSLYGSGAARPGGGYGAAGGSSARPAAGYGTGSPGAGLTGLARPSYGSNGAARPVSYGGGTTGSLPGSRPSGYGAPALAARPVTTSYPATAVNLWAQPQSASAGQQSQQTQSQAGYSYPYNSNHSTYGGGK